MFRQRIEQCDRLFDGAPLNRALGAMSRNARAQLVVGGVHRRDEDDGPAAGARELQREVALPAARAAKDQRQCHVEMVCDGIRWGIALS